MSQGRPAVLLFSEGQMSNHKGTALLLLALPKQKDCPRISTTMLIGSERHSIRKDSRLGVKENHKIQTHTTNSLPTEASIGNLFRTQGLTQDKMG